MDNTDLAEKELDLPGTSEVDQVKDKENALPTGQSIRYVELSDELLAEVERIAAISRKQIEDGEYSSSEDVLKWIREKHNL